MWTTQMGAISAFRARAGGGGGGAILARNGKTRENS